MIIVVIRNKADRGKCYLQTNSSNECSLVLILNVRRYQMGDTELSIFKLLMVNSLLYVKAMSVQHVYKYRRLHNCEWVEVFASGQHKAAEYYISAERKYPISASSYNNVCA